MTKILLCITLFFLFLNAGAQTTLTPQVIASGGGISKFPGIQLEWTMGESVIGSISSSGSLYTVGFHQPIIISNLIKQQTAVSSATVSVFPNPVCNTLKVILNRTNNENFTITLTDIQGRPLVEKTFAGKSTIAEIPFQQFSSGMYLLNVFDTNKTLVNSFKIIKAN